MNCRKPACGQTARARGYCEKHYRYRLHTGRYGYRDVSRARAHVANLRELGWTWQQIADAAGCSTYVPHRIGTWQTKRIWPESEAALLRIVPVPRESHNRGNDIGTRRRIHALMWMGWPAAEIAARVGYKPSTVHAAAMNKPRYGGRGLSIRFARRIAELYEQISHLPGPSKGAASKARKFGYAPPAAWDDDTIDDPRARPAGVRRGDTEEGGAA